jgi:thioredoxin-related protein
MKAFSTLLLTLCIGFASVGFTPRFDDPKPADKKVKWMTIEEAFAAMQKKPKKVFIDVYTDWCGWCKVMDRNTFTNPAIADYLNENYYSVKLNAEGKEDITLGARTYKMVGNVNELAATLLKGQMSYPTTVYLNEKMEVIQPVPGYQEPRAFHQIITYFGGDHNQKEPFDKFVTGTYTKDYQGKLPNPAAAQPAAAVSH